MLIDKASYAQDRSRCPVNAASSGGGCSKHDTRCVKDEWVLKKQDEAYQQSKVCSRSFKMNYEGSKLCWLMQEATLEKREGGEVSSQRRNL